MDGIRPRQNNKNGRGIMKHITGYERVAQTAMDGWARQFKDGGGDGDKYLACTRVWRPYNWDVMARDEDDHGPLSCTAYFLSCL